MKNVRCFTSFFKNPGFSTQGWLHCCSSLHGTLDHRIDGGQCGLHGALHGHRGGRDGHSREDIPGLGRMEDSQGSMGPGRPSVVFTGRLCTDSCSRSSINYGGCDTGGRNWADLKTHVDQPGAGWNQLLSLQVKSALISAIDYGLIKTSYDYAAIESTLVPTMALLLDRINGMISWYHDISVPTYTPDMQKRNYAKDQEAANIHQNPALRKPYVHSFDMVFTDRTAGLKISHREEEWTSGKVKQSTFEMGEVDTNFLSTKLRIFMEETLDSHRLRCCS